MRALVIVFSGLLLAQLAFAKPMISDAGYKGRCKTDAARFCPGRPLGTGIMYSCLRSHETELEAPCAAELKKRYEKFRPMLKACKDDLERLCGKGLGERLGPVINCLKTNEQKLSAGCKKERKKFPENLLLSR